MTTALAQTSPIVITATAPTHRMLARREAAEFCGLSPSSFDRAIARGDLPKGIKIGRRVVWRAAALDAALDRLAAAK